MKKTLQATLAVLLVGAASARAQDPTADAAGAEFLASKALATAKVPEQWIGSYAGSCWTGAVHLAVVEHDEAAAGLRRIDIEKITSREKENPAREVARWWVDAPGVVVRGERSEFESGDDEPKSTVQFKVKNGKLLVQEGEGPAQEPKVLPGAFVPDKLIAIAFVAGDKKKWRFASLEDTDFGSFTIEDLGSETVSGRTGDVSARKLRVTDQDSEKDGEALYWVDDQHRIVAARWSNQPNLCALAGAEEESRKDWWTRPADEFDKAGDKLAASSAKLDALVGEMSYGIYSPHGRLKGTVRARLSKEDKDGKAAFHYLSTIADVTSGGATSTEEWWFTADGKLVSGFYKIAQVGKDPIECRVKVDGDKIVSTVTDPPEGMEEVTCPVPPRLVPDSFLLFKAVAAEAKGSFRWNAFDLAGRYVYSIFATPGPTEEIDLPSGKVTAKRVDFSQNVAQGRAWVDGSGKVLLVIWSDDDGDVFGPIEKLDRKLKAPIGPAGKSTGAQPGEDE